MPLLFQLSPEANQSFPAFGVTPVDHLSYLDPFGSKCFPPGDVDLFTTRFDLNIRLNASGHCAASSWSLDKFDSVLSSSYAKMAWASALDYGPDGLTLWDLPTRKMDEHTMTLSQTPSFGNLRISLSSLNT